MAQAVQSALPSLSIRERDRRYKALQTALRERNVDCAIVVGSNLFYLSNGLPGERMGLFSTDELSTTVVLIGRYLVDLPVSVLQEAQDWVSDIRAAGDAGPIVDRIKELHLEKGTLGLADRDLPIAIHQQLQRALPDAKIVDVSDIFANVRTIKGDEEVALIEQANRVFDAGIRRMFETVRPGMTGAQATQATIQGMWDAGGDLESTMSINFDAVPKQNPALADLCLTRAIRPGDVATLTAHAEYQHYAGHSDQEISFGEPSQMHKELFDAVLHVRDAVLKHVKPGSTQRELIDVYRAACKETPFRSSPHSQIHQYGIDVPEFPGPVYRIPDTGDGKGIGTAGNFTLVPGMIYSISPTLLAPNGEDTLLGGTSLVVTETGCRDLGDRKVEMLVVS